jgi:hypothetical protein
MSIMDVSTLWPADKFRISRANQRISTFDILMCLFSILFFDCRYCRRPLTSMDTQSQLQRNLFSILKFNKNRFEIDEIWLLMISFKISKFHEMYFFYLFFYFFPIFFEYKIDFFGPRPGPKVRNLTTWRYM